MTASIRPAVDADVDALAGLRRAFWQNQLDAGLIDVPQDLGAAPEAIARLVRRPRAIVMLAVGDGDVLGYAAGTIQVAPHLVQPKVAIVEEIYVRPDAAAAGLGSRLADAVFDHLLPDGDGRRQVRVLPANAPALAFWRKHGFRPTLLTLERD